MLVEDESETQNNEDEGSEGRRGNPRGRGSNRARGARGSNRGNPRLGRGRGGRTTNDLIEMDYELGR